jgi:tetratricopeptide (TPR) repeat protein
MSLPAIILLEGLAFALVFSALALMRQEGLSPRLMVETLAVTLGVSGLAAASGYPIHPVLFLIVLYLLTMRVRLLVDVGNALARRRRFARAETVYDLARRLAPDHVGRTVIELNRAAMALQQERYTDAITRLTSLLDASRAGPLGPRYEAAAHYNLGVAYQRTGVEAQAIRAFNAAMDAWPASPYARQAEQALGQIRHQS